MKKRRAFFFGGPVGASLLIALIPGPCTTFDDATPPGADASELDSEIDSEPIVDAAPYVPHCGLTLMFPDANCQMELDNGFGGGRNCCAEERVCGKIDACVAWSVCATEHCPIGIDDSSCAYKGCGPTTEFADALAAISACKQDIDPAKDYCLWP